MSDQFVCTGFRSAADRAAWIALTFGAMPAAERDHHDVWLKFDEGAERPFDVVVRHPERCSCSSLPIGVHLWQLPGVRHA
jgi:hypothetical protein